MKNPALRAMIRPQPLGKGDKVAIVSPAGAIKDATIVAGAASTIESWGLRAVVMPHALSRDGYYAGTEKERLADVVDALCDDEIKAILCSYGGYGCLHLLPRIDRYISENPKWIIGMSDCSVLLAAAVSQGVAALHSPQCRALAMDADGEGVFSLRRLLFGWQPRYRVAPHPLNRKGKAQGRVVGGNLSVLTALVGTPYDIFKKGNILFIEDVNEPLYKIERMLYTMKLSGVLASLDALVVGAFAGCRDDSAFGGTVYDVIRHVVEEYDYPLCFGFPVGHSSRCYPMPVGAVAELEVGAGGVSLNYIP